MLVLGSPGLVAAGGAQAGWERDDYGHATFRQSRLFGQQIDARQARQMTHIRTGMHEGRLNRFEFRELMQEQREIRAMERHFRADGIIDAHEFRRLEHTLDSANQTPWGD